MGESYVYAILVTTAAKEFNCTLLYTPLSLDSIEGWITLFSDDSLVKMLWSKFHIIWKFNKNWSFIEAGQFTKELYDIHNRFDKCIHSSHEAKKEGCGLKQRWVNPHSIIVFEVEFCL